MGRTLRSDGEVMVRSLRGHGEVMVRSLRSDGEVIDELWGGQGKFLLF